VATGTQAVEQFAEATRIPAVTVERAAKVLRVAGLWPKSIQGGGRGAKHVVPGDLVNLLFAMFAADPITAAPTVVEQYRAMRLEGTDSAVRAPTLGDYLQRWIERLSRREFTEATMQTFAAAGGWSCILITNPAPRAIIVVPAYEDQATATLHFAPATEQPSLPIDPLEPAPRDEWVRQVILPFYLTVLLGDLFADTCRHLGSSLELDPPPPVPNGTPPGPETTEAAEAPPSTASGIGQPATKSPAALNSADDTHTPEGAARIASSESQGGRSIFDRKGHPKNDAENRPRTALRTAA
jgi:hypothetical protein